MLASSALQVGTLYTLALALQLFCYTVALAGLVPSFRRFRLVSAGYFFLLMNVAAACGFWYWLTGRSATVWAHSGDAPAVTESAHFTVSL
jgi:hypothetical protein